MPVSKRCFWEIAVPESATVEDQAKAALKGVMRRLSQEPAESITRLEAMKQVAAWFCKEFSK
jgi:hypothetical protein